MLRKMNQKEDKYKERMQAFYFQIVFIVSRMDDKIQQRQF